ncbi:MAG TPA: hypothetical protein VN610_02540 [Bryobacteraceae bacterium]|nr:hypothetical protein [Bryobacteraceae bacterium]
MTKRWLLVAAFAALAVESFAVETKFWEQSDASDFEKGSLERLSLRSDGRLFLAPAVTELFDPSTAYLWSIARDSKGNLYTGGAGTGSDTVKLFRIGPSGHGAAWSELPGLEIHAVAVDHQDRVYAATSPDGKVYRITPVGKPELLYDPHAKYIWAMAFAPDGSLYVATGDPGEIHRVTPDGKGAVFYKTHETHARSLAIDPEGNLIVGTEPNGLILRIPPTGKGFVLYQADKREITAVAIGHRGEIFAAGSGTRATAAPASIVPMPAPTPVPIPSMTQGATTTSIATPPARSAALQPPTVGSSLYEIEPDGEPRTIWTDAHALVYAIAIGHDGRPILGTGNHGTLFRIDSPTLNTRLADLAPTQATAFCPGPDGKLYVATGNIGKVYGVGPALSRAGTFESEVLDAKSFSYWGRLSFLALGHEGHVAFFTRSGNLNHPRDNWSPWSQVSVEGDGGSITSPPARFLQYKIEMTAGTVSPEISEVDLAYLEKNAAPQVERIEITPPNYRFPEQTLTLTPSRNITLPPIGTPEKRGGRAGAPAIGTAQTLSYAKGFLGARWQAMDPNDDTLTYKVEIREAGEKMWRPLKDKVREKELSWDSTAFSDGQYELRVTASDEASNPPAQSLTGALVSDTFRVDNTPPLIEDLSAAKNGRTVTVRFKTSDALSVIDKAEYSIDGTEWKLVEPAGRLSDSRSENYDLTLDSVAPGEHVIAVRVTDEYENQAVRQALVH